VRIKKNIRGLQEAAAPDGVLNAKTEEERFVNAQILRDFGWLYYYILKFQAECLMKTSSQPEFTAKIASLFEQHSVEQDLEKYKVKLLTQQKGNSNRHLGIILNSNYCESSFLL
jgi:hypothetical protein